LEAERWERVQDLFHRICELPHDQQRAALASLCSGDESLINEVLEMLDNDRSTSNLLDTRVDQIAADVLRDPAACKEIGAYRIERVLGEGGMGTVSWEPVPTSGRSLPSRSSAMRGSPLPAVNASPSSSARSHI
jgi:hypothetical protein